MNWSVTTAGGRAENHLVNASCKCSEEIRYEVAVNDGGERELPTLSGSTEIE
jgi:hypothetical protein